VVSGLHVLRLKGSFYEMGRQHGELLRDQVPRGPLPYYRTYVEKMLRNTGAGPLSPLAAAAIERGVGRHVARALPDFARQSLDGLADGAGLSRRRLLEGSVMPDSLMWLAARSMSLHRAGPARAHRLALELGCSSAIAWGPATADGKLLHARNMDYHGVEVWPRTSTVAFHEPDGGQRYVSITAAGVPLGGITAMNEAGLTLTVHQHMFTDATTLGGTPIGVVGDRVMREAETLEQAQAILRSYRPIGCWTYLMTDGPNRDVLCWEENPRLQAAFAPDPGADTFGYANIYLDPELGATERNLYGSYWRANLGRQQKLRQRLEGRSRPLTPDDMAAILGDTGDPECRIRRPLSMLLTVASVVFRPEDGVFWVATGEAPTCNNAFEPFDLRSLDHAPDQGRLQGGVPGDGAAAAAFLDYRDAYVAYFEHRDLDRARQLMERVLTAQPDQPLYHALAGYLAVRAGDPLRARRAFDQALHLGHPDRERLAGFHLWRGRAADLTGDRGAAEADYRAALQGPADPPVERAARAGLRRPFSPRKARRVDVEFAYADVMFP
jgi:tetratricopeptide (TPR) repeat protein